MKFSNRRLEELSPAGGWGEGGGKERRDRLIKDCVFALRLGGVPTSREDACLWNCLEVPPGGCEGSPPRLTDKTRGGVCLTTATKARWWGGAGGGDGGPQTYVFL